MHNESQNYIYQNWFEFKELIFTLIGYILVLIIFSILSTIWLGKIGLIVSTLISSLVFLRKFKWIFYKKIILYPNKLFVSTVGEIPIENLIYIAFCIPTFKYLTINQFFISQVFLKFKEIKSKPSLNDSINTIENFKTKTVGFSLGRSNAFQFYKSLQSIHVNQVYWDYEGNPVFAIIDT